MIARIYDEMAWWLDQSVIIMHEVGLREDCQGLPRKEGVCLYIQRPDHRGRPQGLCRFDLTAIEAHKLAQALELSARALAGKFSSGGSDSV